MVVDGFTLDSAFEIEPKLTGVRFARNFLAKLAAGLPFQNSWTHPMWDE